MVFCAQGSHHPGQTGSFYVYLDESFGRHTPGHQLLAFFPPVCLPCLQGTHTALSLTSALYYKFP